MNDHATTRLSLPLVQAAQAQKHVTVNEALARLDGLVNLVLDSIAQSSPPLTADEGSCFGVPVGASGDWAGQGGRIAIASNGGWVFVDARPGMRCFIRDLGVQAIHDGQGWVMGALSVGTYGSALAARVAETEMRISAGGSVMTDLVIPNAAMVIGATARVTETITGTLTSWRMGTEGALDRFGKELGLPQGSWARGMLSQPFTYWTPAPVMLAATGGEFSGGTVRIAVHWLELTLPR